MAPNTTFQDYLLKERSLALAGNRNISLLAEFGVVCASILILSQAFPWGPILLWAAIAQLASLYSWHSHKNAGSHASTSAKHGQLNNIVFGTWLVASSWGLAPLLFYRADNTTMIVVFVCLYAGYVSGALAVTIAYSRSFIAFAIGITLPFAARLIYEGDELSYIIIALMVFYICMLSYVSFNLQALFEENSRSSFENLRLIDQLKVEKETAEVATLAKSKFLASASHDLRQPIHAANLFLDILTPLQKEQKNQKILQKVRQSMQGLNKMLHGLLDISRLDAGAIENEPQHISLRAIIDPLIAEQAAVKTNLGIENQLSTDIFVHADQMILERVLRNLLDNAVKYSNEGKITFDATQNSHEVVLTLSDTGIGIPSDKLNSIFDEFIQLNNPERNRQKGLGLGLAIVKRLCSLADIDIKIESELDRGTTVFLKMAAGADLQMESVDPTTQNLFGLRVLVIDDEADILEGMSTLLSQWNCQVLAAPNRESAVALMTKNSFVPKVLIADFRLRDHESGLEIIDEFRGLYGEGLITILVTGDTAPVRVAQASESGAKVVYKPVDGITLRTAIQELLAQEALEKS